VLISSGGQLLYVIKQTKTTYTPNKQTNQPTIKKTQTNKQNKTKQKKNKKTNQLTDKKQY
jgi:hypothetical protein